MENKYAGHTVQEVEQDGKTVILIHSKDELGYTGFYKEEPKAVALGDTIEKTLDSLKVAYQAFQNWKEEDKLK